MVIKLTFSVCNVITKRTTTKSTIPSKETNLLLYNISIISWVDTLSLKFN